MLIGSTDNDERGGSDGRKILHRTSLVLTRRFADVRRQDARARSCGTDATPYLRLKSRQTNKPAYCPCPHVVRVGKTTGLGVAVESPFITQEKGPDLLY